MAKSTPSLDLEFAFVSELVSHYFISDFPTSK